MCIDSTSTVFWKKILYFVISNNLELSQRNLLILTFIYWIELLCVLCIYDLVIIKIYSSIQYYLQRLGQYAVIMKKIGITLFTIRLNYYVLRLSELLRLGWLSYGRVKESSVWIGLSKPPLSQVAIKIFRLFLSVPLILAFLSACFSLNIFVGNTNDYLLTIQEFLKNNLRVNISGIFLILPAFLSLITIIPVVFFFYFYSQKRDVRKIIDKENRQYFEEVVLLYEQLLIWIDRHLDKISKNFDNVIKWQDEIVEEILQKKVPNYIPKLNERYKFIEIDDLDELQDIITKLSSDRLVKFTRVFSVKRFDIWHLYFWDFFSLSEEDKIEDAFYTQKGITSKFDKLYTYPYDFTQEQIENMRKEESFILSFSIYDNLELLYRLKKASDSLRKYLYSSRMEQLILKTLNKDK